MGGAAEADDVMKAVGADRSMAAEGHLTRWGAESDVAVEAAELGQSMRVVLEDATDGYSYKLAGDMFGTDDTGGVIVTGADVADAGA